MIDRLSPFQYGFFEGVFLDNDKFPQLNAKIDEIAAKYGVANTATAIVWLLRHPAKMQPVTGTMNVERLKDCVKAADIYLIRKEWYEIYKASLPLICLSYDEVLIGHSRNPDHDMRLIGLSVAILSKQDGAFLPLYISDTADISLKIF